MRHDLSSAATSQACSSPDWILGPALQSSDVLRAQPPQPCCSWHVKLQLERHLGTLRSVVAGNGCGQTVLQLGAVHAALPRQLAGSCFRRMLLQSMHSTRPQGLPGSHALQPGPMRGQPSLRATTCHLQPAERPIMMQWPGVFLAACGWWRVGSATRSCLLAGASATTLLNLLGLHHSQIMHQPALAACPWSHTYPLVQQSPPCHKKILVSPCTIVVTHLHGVLVHLESDLAQGHQQLHRPGHESCRCPVLGRAPPGATHQARGSQMLQTHLWSTACCGSWSGPEQELTGGLCAAHVWMQTLLVHAVRAQMTLSPEMTCQMESLHPPGSFQEASQCCMCEC